MKASTLQSSVRVAFDYKFFDEEGHEQTETVTVQVRRLPFRRLTDLQKQLAGIGDNAEALVDLVSPLIESWDLTDDEGGPWPHDRDALLDLPFDFVSQVAAESVGKLTPGSISAPTPTNSAIA